jgi:hypothetical protein
MNISIKEIKIRELVEGYIDLGDDGVYGYSKRLDIRPPYQREFIYDEKKRNSVIDTVVKEYPLNVMYWAVREDGGYEIIDGQQRTLSLCKYISGDFSFNNLYFHNLQYEQKEKILDYKLMVYWCSGTDTEKLEWFRTINIAGEKLTDQELKNAVYHGTWVTDAKRYFSKNQGPAYQIGNKYLKGSAIRQEYLETAIEWISGGSVDDYMAINQHRETAEELWIYFNEVIDWVKRLFPNYRNEMKSIDWGLLYNEYKRGTYLPTQLEAQVAKMMEDDEIGKKSGIYYFVFDGKEKHLNLRSFTASEKRGGYERQNGICAWCKEYFEIEEMEADHIIPWSIGGKTTIDNLQLLCVNCNRTKSNN